MCVCVRARARVYSVSVVCMCTVCNVCVMCTVHTDVGILFHFDSRTCELQIKAFDVIQFLDIFYEV